MNSLSSPLGFPAVLARLIESQREDLLSRWRQLLAGSGAGRIKDAELQKQCRDFLAAIGTALDGGAQSVSDPAFAGARALLGG